MMVILTVSVEVPQPFDTVARYGVVALGVTNTGDPLSDPGFHVMGLILAMANKLTDDPAQMEVSVLAVIVGIGITVTLTVSLLIPQALFTVAI